MVGFNCPYQVGKYESSNEKLSNLTDMAAVDKQRPVENEHEVRFGRDFVVMGSDGLFDNLFDKEIESKLKAHLVQSKHDPAQLELVSPERAAREIAHAAYERSRDKNSDSPFSAVHNNSLPKKRIGGKPDDITVVVSQIVERDHQPAQAEEQTQQLEAYQCELCGERNKILGNSELKYSVCANCKEQQEEIYESMKGRTTLGCSIVKR